MEIKGIDISTYQGSVDFNHVDELMDFVVLRSSYGVGYVDDRFTDYKIEVRNRKIPHAFYHYAYPNLNSATDEANFFCAVVKDLQEGEVLCLDWEEPFSGDHQAWCKTFLDAVSQKFNGIKPFIYINKSIQNGHDWSQVVRAGYPLWLADYAGDGHAAPWDFIAMKQTTSAGKVEGIKGNVDIDVFYGDLNTFFQYGFQPTKLNENENMTKEEATILYEDLYKVLLGRNPEEGSEGWIDRILKEGSGKVFESFIHSPEFLQRKEILDKVDEELNDLQKILKSKITENAIQTKKISDLETQVNELQKTIQNSKQDPKQSFWDFIFNIFKK